MDARTLKALRGSIKKWELIVVGDGVDRGAENCALCDLFLDRGCDGCPVGKKSGESNCINTPFMKWMDAFGSEHITLTGEPPPLFCHAAVIGPVTQAAAIAEHDFLVSLLP